MSSWIVTAVASIAPDLIVIMGAFIVCLTLIHTSSSFRRLLRSIACGCRSLWTFPIDETDDECLEKQQLLIRTAAEFPTHANDCTIRDSLDRVRTSYRRLCAQRDARLVVGVFKTALPFIESGFGIEGLSQRINDAFDTNIDGFEALYEKYYLQSTMSTSPTSKLVVALWIALLQAYIHHRFFPTPVHPSPADDNNDNTDDDDDDDLITRYGLRVHRARSQTQRAKDVS